MSDVPIDSPYRLYFRTFYFLKKGIILTVVECICILTYAMYAEDLTEECWDI